MEFKTYIVRTQRLAGYLMLNGFVLHEIKKSNEYDRNVFLFTNSESLRNAIEQYKVSRMEHG